MRDERHSEKTEAILEAAGRVLARDGAAALSLNAIAKELDTHKSHVLYHFGSKSDLIDEMARKYTRPCDTQGETLGMLISLSCGFRQNEFVKAQVQQLFRRALESLEAKPNSQAAKIEYLAFLSFSLFNQLDLWPVRGSTRLTEGNL